MPESKYFLLTFLLLENNSVSKGSHKSDPKLQFKLGLIYNLEHLNKPEQTGERTLNSRLSRCPTLLYFEGSIVVNHKQQQIKVKLKNSLKCLHAYAVPASCEVKFKTKKVHFLVVVRLHYVCCTWEVECPY